MSAAMDYRMGGLFVNPRELERRRVKFKASSTPTWRRVGEVDIPVTFSSYQEYCKAVISLLRRDAAFRREIAKNNEAIYAVIRLFQNRIEIRMVTEAVVLNPKNDLLTDRGYDSEQFVVMRFDPKKNSYAVVDQQQRSFILNLYSDCVFERPVTAKDHAAVQVDLLLQN